MMKILPEQHGNLTFTDFLIFISLISYKFGCPPILVLLNYFHPFPTPQKRGLNDSFNFLYVPTPQQRRIANPFSFPPLSQSLS